MDTELYATHYLYRVEDQAIASIHRYGDCGIIFGMLGKDLLKHLLHDLIDGALKNVGITRLEGYVSPAIATAIKFVCRREKQIHIDLSDTCSMDNRDSVWIRVEVKRDA